MPKKRYVKKNQSQYLSISMVSQPEPQPQPQLTKSTARLGNFDSEDEAIEVYDLDLNDKQILHLWLVELLPGSKYAKYTVKLTEKKIQGDAVECERKIEEIKQYLEKYCLKSISDLETKLDFNFKMALNRRFNAKIFEKDIIIRICQQVAKGYNFRPILKTIEPFTKKQFFYLVSIEKIWDKNFIDWFEQNKNKTFTRTELDDIKNETRFLHSSSVKVLPKMVHSGSLTSRVKVGDEQKQSSVQEEPSQEENFYTMATKKTENNLRISQAKIQEEQKPYPKKEENDAQFQKNQEKKRKYVRKDLQTTSQENPKSYRRAQKQKAQKILSVDYLKTIFDLDAFKKWVKYNKELRLEQFEFTNNDKMLNIQLLATGNAETKLRAVNIYLKFTKIILTEGLNSDHRSQIQKQFCSKKQTHIECQFVQGFMQSTTHQHKLRTLISEGKIMRSDRRNKKFVAIKIMGLNPYVEKLEEDIRDFISNLPKQDKTQNLILNLDTLEQYLHEDKVRALVQNVLGQFIKRTPELTLVSINYPGNKASLKLKITHQYYDTFLQNKLALNDTINTTCFQVQQLVKQSEITDQLLKKYLLLRSVTDETKYVLICQKNKAIQITKEILNCVHESKSKLDSFEINFKKGRYVALKNFIDDLQLNPKLKQLMPNIKFSFTNESKLTLYGSIKNMKQFQNAVNEYLSKLDLEVVGKSFQVTGAEAVVIEKNMGRFGKEIYNQFKLSFNLSRDINMGAIFYLGTEFKSSPLSIVVQKNKDLEKIQGELVVVFQSQDQFKFFPQKYLTEAKAYLNTQDKYNFNIKKDFDRDCYYVYCESFKNVEHMVMMLWQNYPFVGGNSKVRNFAFVMSKKQKAKFVFELLVNFEKFCKSYNIKVYIFEEAGQDLAKSLATVKDFYGREQKVLQFYVQDGKKQFFYSSTGDAKINKALQKGQKHVYLTNEDLNLDTPTHIFSLPDRTITHIQSSTVTKLQYVPTNRYTFTLKGIQFEIPKKQIDKVLAQQQQNNGKQVQVSVGAYELDLGKMKQTNMFSNFVRDLQKKEHVTKKKLDQYLTISLDEKINEVQIEHEPKDQKIAVKACQKLKALIQAERIKQDHNLEKPITQAQFQNLKQSGQQIDVNVEWDGKTMLTFSSFEKNNIVNLIKNIKLFLWQAKQVKFPEKWQKQKSEIETFTVSPTTKQFQDIQKIFSIHPIKQLLRIQNSLVYKKYEDQRLSLTALNNGKPIKQMMLFHGTRSTDPKLIYEDKQQCFNINYTSDNNFLGRGTYFAERAQYSHGYAHTTTVQERGFFSRNTTTTKSMFLCAVLVGDSQLVQQANYGGGMRDTVYKDQKEKIRYESATTFTNGSNIYTVYKNRRAYPHYLIHY